MPLFTIKASNKIDTSMRLEESTARMLDRYAHYNKASADAVVNESLEYIFRHDKEFQQYLSANPAQEVPQVVRVKKTPTPSKGAKKAGSATSSAEPATTK